MKLSENFKSLSSEEQASTRELMRKRLIHFYYAAMTMKLMPDHFDALRKESLILRAKPYDRTTALWDGDSGLLNFALIQAIKQWPLLVRDGESSDYSSHEDQRQQPDCPIEYSEDDIHRYIDQHNQREERMQELEDMQDFLATDALGWVPDDEHYERSKDLIQTIKAGMLQNSENGFEKSAVQNHFQFDDHDEID